MEIFLDTQAFVYLLESHNQPSPNVLDDWADSQFFSQEFDTLLKEIASKDEAPGISMPAPALLQVPDCKILYEKLCNTFSS